MSEKQAKQARREDQHELVGKLTAIFYKDGYVQISGFPTDFEKAMFWVHTINKGIANHFVQKGRDKGVIVQPPAHIIPGLNNKQVG